jgi:hypothetical protein
MAKRWVEFVKKIFKRKKMSYSCAMCEIKFKGLYKPLTKDVNKEDPQIFTIQSKNILKNIF